MLFIKRKFNMMIAVIKDLLPCQNKINVNFRILEQCLHGSIRIYL